MTKVTTGRIVHFFDSRLANDVKEANDERSGQRTIALNGQGFGPYPALVLQAPDGEGNMANLRISAWGGEWNERNVPELDPRSSKQDFWWTWPPVATVTPPPEEEV